MKIPFKIYNKLSIVAMAVLTVVGVSLTSCEEDDKNALNDFITNGGFVRFVGQNPPSEVGVNDVSELIYSFSVEDGNGSVAMYDLKMFADLAGSRTDTVQVAEVTSFPQAFNFTTADLASLLGVAETAIGFGDQFFFTATATTNDGVVYGGADRLNFEQVFPQPDGSFLDDNDRPVAVGDNDIVFTNADGESFLVGGQGSTDDLLDEAGYRQAFEFDFIILCPPPASVDDLVGTWQITVDPFVTFIDDGIFEVVAGPGANQATALDIFDHPNPDTGGTYDVVFDLDPNTGIVTVERQPAWHCVNFGCGFGEGRIDGGGFLFNCVGNGLLKFSFEHTVDAGSFGTFAMDMLKL